MPHQDMHQRDERWELASRAAQEGIWDWDLRTNKVYRSETWFELFGYEPGELADNPWVWENMIHPDDAAEVLDARRKHIDGMVERYYVEHRMRCRDGRYRWFLSRGQVIRNDQGEPIRMTGFYTNIDARVAAREQLLRENAYSGSSGQRSDVIRPVIPVGSGQVFRSDPASRSDGIRPMHPSGCPRYLKEQFVLVYQKSAGYQICTASL